MFLSSGELMVRLIKRPVSKHREEHVATPAGESDEGLVVSFPLGDLAVVIGAGNRVAKRREGGEEQRSFQDLVSSS